MYELSVPCMYAKAETYSSFVIHYNHLNKKDHPAGQAVSASTVYLLYIPTDPFPFLELQNQPHHAPDPHKMCRSPDHEELKL